MKKFMAILLAMMLVLGLMPTVLAANANEGSVVINASVDSTDYTAGGVALKAGASSSEPETGVSLSGNTFTFTANDTDMKNTYGYLYIRDFSPKMSNGTMEVTQKISFTNPEKSIFRPTGKCYNFGNKTVFDSGAFWIMNEGKFFDNETECVAGKEYIFTTTFNTDTNVMTWNVVNEELGVNITKNHQYSADNNQVNLDCLWYLTWVYNASEAGSILNIKDVTVEIKDLTFAHIERLAYIEGAEETFIADSEEVPYKAESVKVVLSGVAAKVAGYSGDVATLKKVEGDTETTVLTTETSYWQYAQNDGYEPYVIVTPENGFEPGATYKLYLTNLRDTAYGVPMPEGGVVKTFTVADSIGFRSIKDGDVITTTSATLSAYIPYPENGVKFVLDGKELTPVAGEGNVYSASVEGMANGLHRFTVISGEESKTITFTSAHVPNYLDIMATAIGNEVSPMVLEKCVGSDGVAESGLQLSGSKGGIHLRHSTMYYNSNRSVWFEADIKRIGNAGFQIYGTTTPSKNYPVLTGNIIIQRGTPEGTICGTSHKIAQNDAQWHNLRIIQQLKHENSEYLVYLDGELIKRDTIASWINSEQTALSISRFELLSSSSPMQIDNARFGEIVSPIFVSAAYKKDAAAEEFTAATDDIISGVSKVIKITQLNNPLTLEGVEVTVNGVASTAVIDSADANSLIVTPADGSINANEDVVIKVGNYVTVLKADGDTYDNMGELTLSVDGDSAVAKIKIAKANVGESTLGDSVLLMIASYDSTGTRLKAVNLIETTLLSGAHEYSAPLTSLNGGTNVKAMLWNSSSALNPILNSITVPVSAE